MSGRRLRLPWLRRAIDDFELLLEGKLLLFLIGDFLAVVWGLFAALTSGGRISQVYPLGVVLPMLLVLGTALSALIALERRAGSLDLALAAPSPPLFFLRRIWPPLALAVLQSWILLLLSFLERSRQGWPDLLRAFFSTVLVAVLAAAIALFWATRLRTGGAVFAAYLLTLLPLLPFVLSGPTLPPPVFFASNLFVAWQHYFHWLWPMLVMLVATLLFFLGGLDRLRRPEMLS